MLLLSVILGGSGLHFITQSTAGLFISVSTEQRNSSKKGVVGGEGFDGEEIGVFACLD